MTRRPRGGWPESGRHDCQQLRQTQHGFGRRAPDRHRLRASSLEWSWKTCPACRTPNAGCAGAAIGSARLRGLLGVRVSQPDVTAPSPRPACSRARGLFARWQLPPDHPITAPGYSARRSAMAKRIGLVRGRKTANAAPPAEPEPAPPNKPRRRSRSHQAPTTESSTS